MTDRPGKPFDTVVKTRAHILGEAEDHYGIWNRRAPSGEPIERFPLTEDGFQAAESRLLDLKWEGRRKRLQARLPRILSVGVAGGAAAWMVAGVLSTVTALFINFGETEVAPTIFHLTWLIDVVGFRVMVGSSLVIGGALLIRWGSERSVAGLGVAHEGPGWSAGARLPTLLVGAAGTGLAVWIAMATATQWLFQAESGFGAIARDPSRAYVVSSLVETVALRVWVAGTVMLVLLWLYRRIRSTA